MAPFIEVVSESGTTIMLSTTDIVSVWASHSWGKQITVVRLRSGQRYELSESYDTVQRKITDALTAWEERRG